MLNLEVNYVLIFCRLTGIIEYDGMNHYMALCNRKGMRWKLCNDMANDVTFVHVRKVIQPGAVVYIRVKE